MPILGPFNSFSFIFYMGYNRFPSYPSCPNACLSYVGSGPKGPMSCRTQGWISIRPSSFHPSIPPLPPSRLAIGASKQHTQAWFWPSKLYKALKSSRPQISPMCLKSALKTTSLPPVGFRGLKTAWTAWTWVSRPQGYEFHLRAFGWELGLQGWNLG